MKLSRMLRTARGCCQALLFHPLASIRDLSHVPERVRAKRFVPGFGEPCTSKIQTAATDPSANGQEHANNPLRNYFDQVSEGPGIWKWLHYFDIYHRHLQKFIGQEVSIVEVGVYSGGSMPMWRDYLGPRCRVHGVDIQPECKVYENDYTTIHIGDQADRQFWQRFRQAVPQVDILIDDGGHQPEQQIVTLEETLSHLRPGGVFICEDIHGLENRFTSYVNSLTDGLHAMVRTPDKQEIVCATTPFQSTVKSVSLYPYTVVIEKADAPIKHLAAPKHGTQWQPFL